MSEDAVVHRIAATAIARATAELGVRNPFDSVASQMLAALKLVKGKMSVGPDYERPYMPFDDVMAVVKKTIARAEPKAGPRAPTRRT